MRAAAYRQEQEAAWERTAWATALLLRPYQAEGAEPLTGKRLLYGDDPEQANAAFDALLDPGAAIDAALKKQASRKPHG